jgi:hypothetical protein
MKPAGPAGRGRKGTGWALHPGTPDPALVDGFVAGTLDEQEESALAGEVAHLLPLHWRLPNPMVAALSLIITHLGGQAELLAWLDQYPGEPRAVARLYRLVDLLDRVSGDEAVVSALADLRAQDGEPPDLARYLVPDTNSATLASLATEIELLLADEQTGTALQVGAAAADLLHRLAGRAGEVNSELGEHAARMRQEIQEAADEIPSVWPS